MRMQAVRAIFRKEIREICRDKKTIFLMFAMPLIIYPLLIIGISTIMINVESKYDTDSYSIVMENVDEALSEKLLQRLENVDYKFEKADCANPVEALSENEVDIILRAEGPEYTIEYNSASSRSEKAEGFLYEQLEQYSKELSTVAISTAGLDPEVCLNPIHIQSIDKASDEKAFGSILGGIVPLLLILGVFLGAMTPAMDVTAGEKERGTQETLITFPISGHELIFGKYLAVALSGALSAILYMVTIGLIGFFMFSMIGAAGAELAINLRAFIPSIAVLFIAVLAFALLLGAAMMCVCTFAGSEKEASSYLSPIMVVVMLLSYVGFLDVHLTPALAVVPVLNIVLLIKSVLIFEYNAGAIILVLVSNLAYASIAITILGKLYTSERVLFGEKEGSLLERRSVRTAGSVPTIGDSMLTMLVTLVLYLYLGALLQVKYLLIGVGFTQLIIAAVPVFAAWYGRVDMKTTFRLKGVDLRIAGASLVLAVGAFLLCNTVCQPIARIAEESAETYTQAFELLEDGQSFALTLLVVGILPAICEEVLFRGYLLSSFTKKTRPWAAIVLSAILFGVFHMNLYQGCYAFLLGLILAFTIYRSGSIVCSCLIHFVCNSLAVLLTYFPDEICTAVPILSSETPAAMVVISAIGAGLTALGLFLFVRFSRKK